MKISDIKEVIDKQQDNDYKKAMDNFHSLFKSKPCTRLKVPSRNDPCTCGSGKKYKNCCMEIDNKLINNYDERGKI